MRTSWSGAVVCIAISCLAASGSTQNPASELAGLWQAKQRFGPDVRGRLLLDRSAGAWRAQIAGRTAAVRMAGDTVQFRLPDGDRFVGRRSGASIVGHWIRATRSASPLTLTACGSDCFTGEVRVPDDALTFYLKVTPAADGSVQAFLRNPERNLGGPFIPVRRLERRDSVVSLLGARGQVLLTGRLDDDLLTIPIRGRSYDFRRVPDTAHTDFYPRGRPSASYEYLPPRQKNDGWTVGRLRDVGLSEDSIAAIVRRLIAMPIDSVATPATHALLIARHGKLVLEEYFFGEHADKPHNTRSGSKTHLSVLIGAAMRTGTRIAPEMPVYATLRPEARDLAPQKRAMTLEHMLTMSAGYDCDDSGDRPGDESTITDQDTNADWTRMILDLPTVRDPGTLGVYCSIKPHIAGAMLTKLSGRWLPELFRERVAEPMDMGWYSFGLTPRDEIWGGGGHEFLARDYLKMAQLYLDGGVWRGRRIVSKEWVDRSVAPRFKIGANQYGYLWWIREYQYRGRPIKAYYLAGNGTQISMWIPELDLAVMTFGGNYNSPSINWVLQQLIPRSILPAIIDP
jgi:CubicO group peptidase (beta-lactamase class C family)